MYGKATIEIPRSGNIGPSRTTGLSDQQAIGFARIAAMTLSEHDGQVTVTLESGDVRVIGFDPVREVMTFGSLHPNYRSMGIGLR